MNIKKILIYAGVFIAGVITAEAVRKLPLLKELPKVGA